MQISVRHRLLVLPIAPVVLGMLLGCNRSQTSSIDVQKTIVALGVHVHQTSIYPTMLTPFLDEKKPDEGLLKNFLKNVDNLHIYRLPVESALDGFAERLEQSGYTLLLDVEQNGHCLKVYGIVGLAESIRSLIVLLRKSHAHAPSGSSNACYCIEVIGNISQPELTHMASLNPALIDQYIRRFNIQF
ncbi:MAG: hypothetical protein LBK18_09330 [Prevotellaceae bacterium]|nr:hypothetical protein [Prevotellaceae bacterium]